MKGRCQRYQRDALNSMRPFLFFDPKKFSLISQFLEVAQVKGRCQWYQRGSMKSMRQFSFFAPKFFFFYISISGGRKCEKKQSMVPTPFPEEYAIIFVFLSKIFISISQFLEISHVKRRCQRYRRGALNSMQLFVFFGPKNFP